MAADSKLGAVLKTLLFTIALPCSLTAWIPLFLLVPERKLWHSPAGWFGWVLIAVGALIYFVCAFDFSVEGRGTPAPIDPPKKVIAGHLYRYTRNPMYVGVLTVLVGEALLLRSEALLGYAAIVAVGFHLFVMLYEEPALTRKFGDPYREYCRRVPRWLPAGRK